MANEKLNVRVRINVESLRQSLRNSLLQLTVAQKKTEQNVCQCFVIIQ